MKWQMLRRLTLYIACVFVNSAVHLLPIQRVSANLDKWLIQQWVINLTNTGGDIQVAVWLS